MLNEPKAPDVNAELTDEQLEQAAGGVTYVVEIITDNLSEKQERRLRTLNAQGVAVATPLKSLKDVSMLTARLESRSLPYRVIKQD